MSVKLGVGVDMHHHVMACMLSFYCWSSQATFRCVCIYAASTRNVMATYFSKRESLAAIFLPAESFCLRMNPQTGRLSPEPQTCACCRGSLNHCQAKSDLD